jgi:2-keto-3-deoxy-6-phosphogluconate aldolase
MSSPLPASFSSDFSANAAWPIKMIRMILGSYASYRFKVQGSMFNVAPSAWFKVSIQGSSFGTWGV